MLTETKKKNKISIPENILLKAYELMCTAKSMSELYEEKSQITSKYVHATSRGHEAVQIALGLQMKPQDYLSLYYRDDSVLLAIGMKPYELMLQLMAKRDDPFSGGRTYYSHPSLRRDNMPKIPHQSSATGMQAIPTTGIAMGIQYLEKQSPSPALPKGKGEEYSYMTADTTLYNLLKNFSEEHRRTPTKAELVLWDYLKGNQLDNYHFRRQHIIGKYIADFVCLEKKLIVEVDGLIHQLPDNKESDEVRTRWLTEKGFAVLRFKNEEIIGNIERALERIREKLKVLPFGKDLGWAPPVVVCSLGDASITEGEVAEAFQMAVLKKLPILYFVQDNEWDISADAKETRAMDATEYAKGFKGLETRTIEGNDFFVSYETIREVIEIIREERRPFLIHAKVPLLGHHTSGVRKEWYRNDLETHQKKDPFPIFTKQLMDSGFDAIELKKIEQRARQNVRDDFERAMNAEDPRPADLFKYDFAPTPIMEEKGERAPAGNESLLMVDHGVRAVKEILAKHPEALLYGQDVGLRLGGVFREAALLAKTFGDERVFNTPIQEAFIIGSTVGMSAAGCKPIVEIQFADYIWPGLNQLFTEVSRSYYLSSGKWPVSCVIRVPTGAYGSGGPYHSSSVESVLANIRGIKIAYPSNGADLKGLMKAAFYDPNPVVIFEHKGLYWSKLKGTEDAKCIEPSEDYVIPLGIGRIVQSAEQEKMDEGNSLSVITYGMGVYWAKSASKNFPGQVEIVDLRTLVPLDEKLIFESVKRHGKCLVVTEEPVLNTFAQSLAGRIQKECFKFLDAPVEVIGSENLPAIPLNSTLEHAMLPDAEKVAEVMEKILNH